MSVNFGFGPRFPITCIMLFNYLNINQLWGHNRHCITFFSPDVMVLISDYINLMNSSLQAILAKEAGNTGETQM
jgi:hypothetical protein